MTNRRNDHIKIALPAILLLFLLCVSACNSTKYLHDGQYLVKKNTIKLKAPKGVNNKQELKDNLQHLAQPKPNTLTLGIVPFKLWLYNIRYKKYQADTSNFQLKSKTVEPPSLLDTALVRKSVGNMTNYMVNKGFFYSKIRDSIRLKSKKAYITYDVESGPNYLINKVEYDVSDSTAAKIIRETADASGLVKNAPFTNSMLEDERSRLAQVMRDHGYYRFSQENVTFQLDTLNKMYFKNAESPVESALNFITQQKANVKPTLNIIVFVRPSEERDTLVYTKYSIASVTVYPDYDGPEDMRDSTTMRSKMVEDVRFKYHKYYVHENVLLKHIYLMPGHVYTQSDYDKTIVKLNELGIFQFIRITFTENKKNKNSLDCNIFLNRTKKHDFSTNYEVSSGSTYSLGNSVSLNYRDRNLLKGANLFTASVSGGVELIYDENYGRNFLNHFYLLTEYYGLNGSIDFPKFIAPIAARTFSNSNLPHTIVNVGTNLIDRLNYFTLVNTSANYTYSWQETSTKTWTLAPVFINIIRLPTESDSFKARLDTNAFLRDSYKQNFIEGENISFTFSDIEKKRGVNYSFLKLGAEEAGALLGGINSFGAALNDLYKIDYAQYVKFDFDARHYFTQPHATYAFRFYGGVGLPYGQSDALPYIKQYFVGGPYSLRGWRIRTLGPGSYYTNTTNLNYIDLTGDIKLEANGEYRFVIGELFGNSIKMNGALFADAGNIWLARKSSDYPGGEFQLSTLGQDIAMDMGAGARFDVASFLTVRLDAAIPVKKPYVFTNGGWVFNQISPSDPTWRANNVIINIAIGYPF